MTLVDFGGCVEAHPHARARVGWGGEGVWIEEQRGGGVGPPGLLPAPVVPRRLAVPSRFTGSYPGLQNLSFIGGPAQVLIFGERSDGGRIKGAQRLREEKFRRFSFKIVDFHRFSSKFAAIHAPARLRPR